MNKQEDLTLYCEIFNDILATVDAVLTYGSEVSALREDYKRRLTHAYNNTWILMKD